MKQFILPEGFPHNIGHEANLVTFLLFNKEATKADSAGYGDFQNNSTASRINQKHDDSGNHNNRWILSDTRPEPTRFGRSSQPTAHYYLNPRFREQALAFVNFARSAKGLTPLEMPPLPNYPKDHPIHQLKAAA